MQSDQQKKQTCILVLGMHRSGTSAFTRAISLMGVGLPQNILEAGSDNPSGFWEPQEIVELNVSMLADVGSDWYDWRSIEFSDPVISAIADNYKLQISESIRRNFGDEKVVILKDPRICRLVPLYEGALEAAGFTPKYLLPIRRPAEVAKSLEIRNGFPRSQGTLLWLRHVLDAERATRGEVRAIALYDRLLENWENTLQEIAHDLDLSWTRSYEDARTEMGAFLDPDLKHHDGEENQGPLSKDRAEAWAEEVYTLLSAPLSSVEIERLDTIRDHLNLISPIVFRHHSELVAGHPQSPDRYLGTLAEISDMIREVRSRQIRLSQNTNGTSKLPANAAGQIELAQLINENEQLSQKATALLSENQSAAEARLNAEQLNAQLAEEIASLQQEVSRLSAEALAASEARRFAEERCMDMATKYWSDVEQMPPSDELGLTGVNDPASPQLQHESNTKDEAAAGIPEIDTMNEKAIGPDYVGQTYDVVIPLHNSVHWLALCLEELFRYQHRNLGEVIVVDDRSHADQSEQARQIVARFPAARLIVNTAPTGGFGHACNMGAAAGKSPLILLLNTDCLVTEHSLDLLSETMTRDDTIALACPLSNNSPLLTYPMFPGRSYIDMSELMRSSSAGTRALEACTIVGNCLMVKRDYFDVVGGFSPEWREGYGEETELQMKAMKYGLKGVVDIRSYVFHFGGGTFNYLEGADELRLTNHKRFMGKWRKEYEALERRTRNADPIQAVDANSRAYFARHPEKEWPVDVDVLFYLPGLRQDIGGLSAVVAICNALVRSGIKATCALVGPGSFASASAFKEPILFNFLTYVSDAEFLRDTVVRPKIVFSSIFTSAAVVAEFSEERGCLAAQFVQGYEPFFENGKRRLEALSSYEKTDLIVTTSSWLAEMVARNLNEKQRLIRLPLLPNPDIFFSGSGDRDIDVCVVLRGAPDKGQWLLLEAIGRLEQSDRNIVVVSSPDYAETLAGTNPKVSVILGPLDHYELGRLFRRSKVFLDASHHEGFGLLPMEAAMSGCHIVVSDSGGVRDMRGAFSVDILPLTADPQPFVEAVESFLTMPPETALSQTPNALWENYNQNIEKWVDAIRTLTAGVNPQLIRRPPAAPAVFSQGRHKQPGSLKRRALTLVYRRYQVLKPYLPKRVTTAMRMLILGR